MPTFPPSPAFEEIVARLRDERSFAADAYKRSTIERRLAKRARDLGLASYDEYLAHLDREPGELVALLDALLIGVTAFFRDPDTWERLRTVDLPALVARRGPDHTVRAWVAGCATGEEAYTVAMLLAEAVGEGAVDRLRVFATDIDDAALAVARRGCYPTAALEDVPEELRREWLEPRPEGDHQVAARLRGSVVFGHQDVLVDTPITRVDLVICRNVVMYFTAGAQRQLVERFHHALEPGGLLVLGGAETLLVHADRFAPVDARLRVFARVPAPPRAAAPDDQADEAVVTAGDGAAALAVERSDAPQIVVDDQRRLVIANRAGRHLLGVGTADIGRPVDSLDLDRRAGVVGEVIAEATDTGAPVVRRAVGLVDGQLFDVHAVPLDPQSGAAAPVLVSFVDVTRHQHTQEALDEANMALGRAYEELEAANDELQATVQELETTNEELRASNEELEVMNQELVAASDELGALNAELDRRSSDVERVNAFLASVIDGLDVAVVVVDLDHRVRAWNRRAAALWGVTRTEAIGRPLAQLDLRLPMENVVRPLRAVLAGEPTPGPVAVALGSGDSDPGAATLAYAALLGAGGAVEGAILLVRAG